MNKSIIAGIILSCVSGAAFAGAGADLYNQVSSNSVSFQQTASIYSGFDAAQQAEFINADISAGTNYRIDLKASSNGAVTTPHLDGQHNQGTPGMDGRPGRNGVDGKNGVDGAAGLNGINGTNGVNGINGRDGVTTIKHEQVIDTVSRAQIKSNTQRIDNNEKRIAKNEQDISDVKRSVKNLGAGVAASANLHYNRSESGYAVAIGEYEGATAIAGGMQFGISENTAATIQVSYDGEGTGASLGFHGNF